MSGKTYLHLLLFCGILCQGILATLSEEDNRASSAFLERKRRMIDHLPGGRNVARIETVNYVVRIKENNRGTCAGAILSHYTVITAASCIRKHESDYKILSGGAYDASCNSHNVTSSVNYYGSHPRQSIDGIALLTVDPTFEYNSKTGNIHLHLAPIPAGTLATVSGWGCFYPLQPGPDTRPRLISTTLPTMNHEECEHIYRSNFNRLHLHDAIAVTDKHICTYHEQKYCARGDAGAPLVVHNLLVGIHVWKGEFPSQRNPDVYINFQRADYRDWINEHSLLM